jgi:excisionase family DNA binding protein
MDILIEGGKNLGSTTETRKLLGCSRETIIHLLKTGQIDGFKFGRNWRVLFDSVNRYIESQIGTANKKVHRKSPPENDDDGPSFIESTVQPFFSTGK